MRLHGVAPSSEFEAQASLHLPTGAPITTSGLGCDADGSHTSLENNRGQKQWKQMQRQLNTALDSIAARSDNSVEALQVDVMAMGDARMPTSLPSTPIYSAIASFIQAKTVGRTT